MIKFKKSLANISLFTICFNIISLEFPSIPITTSFDSYEQNKTSTDISKKVKILHKINLETDLPKWIENNSGIQNEELSYWLNKLPYEQDKNKDEYIVLPSVGMIMPINNIGKDNNDHDKLINGKEINFNKYLKSGSLKYPGTSSNGYGESGNTVIFGHSSYYKKDDGRYKTAFQSIILLNENEEIWIYKKDNSNNKYKIFKYSVEKSYNTKPTDTNILKATDGKNLTLFTCTPIGGIEGRWVVKAKYIEEIKEEKIISLNTIRLSNKIKNIVNKLSENEKKKTIIYLYNILNENSDKKLNIKNENDLNYLKIELLKLYFS